MQYHKRRCESCHRPYFYVRGIKRHLRYCPDCVFRFSHPHTLFSELSPDKTVIIPSTGFRDKVEAKLRFERLMKRAYLKSREKKILMFHSDGFTFREIGEWFSLGKSRVCEIYWKAIEKIKKRADKIPKSGY